ncbi:MAG: endonuclease/exonuclease/phosphatase family protein [Minisyncoccia bacterium]|jgi:endonuclease/exonuclease/phosphatase family metal-dependent hydrolase
MKLLTLNTWGGKVHEPLLKFIEQRAEDTDIFCLQEVFSATTDLEISDGARANLHQDVSKILGAYRAFHSPKSKGYDYSGYIGKDLNFGNAIFIKKNIPILSYDEMFNIVSDEGYDWGKNAIAKAQFMTIQVDQAPLAICNFHGMWIKDTKKKDTPERIEQSHHIRKILDSFSGEKIICGDFNLLPGGESIKILEKGMRNLIADYHVTSTRSQLYKKDIKFADYILTSPGIKVKDFKVLPDEVSDHLALELDFSI